jgi:hypothetical protein
LLRSCCYNGDFNKFEIDAFHYRSCLLHKYIDQREEMELETLFAIEHLDCVLKNPPGKS